MQTAEDRAGAVKSCLQRVAKEGHKERQEIGVFASSGHGIVILARCGLRSTEGTPDAVLTGWCPRTRDGWRWSRCVLV